jgi:hypothetical protein
VPTVAKAKADSDSTMPAVGVAATAIADASFGKVQILGDLSGIDLSAYSDGDTLYVSDTTAGAFTSTKPDAGALMQVIGYVVKANAAGILHVAPLDYTDPAKILLDEDDFASNSDDAGATQQSIKSYVNTYVDSEIITDHGALSGLGDNDHPQYALLSNFKRIVAVKYAEFTGTQTNSTGADAGFNIANLSINHALTHADNKIILLGQVGIIAASNNAATAGCRFTVDGAVISVGDASSSRARVGAGGNASTTATWVTKELFIQSLYSPGNTSSKTYRLQGVNAGGGTMTIYINRSIRDDSSYDMRGVSSLLLIEVSA